MDPTGPETPQTNPESPLRRPERLCWDPKGPMGHNFDGLSVVFRVFLVKSLFNVLYRLQRLPGILESLQRPPRTPKGFPRSPQGTQNLQGVLKDLWGVLNAVESSKCLGPHPREGQGTLEGPTDPSRPLKNLKTLKT